MEKKKKPFYKRWWFIIIMIFVVGSMFSGDGEDNEEVAGSTDVKTEEKAEKDIEAKPEKVVAEKKPEKVVEKEPEVTKYKAGSYKVGTDIPAGEYKIFTDSMGYAEISKDSSGDIMSIIANDNFSTFIYFTVKDGEFLKLQFSYAIPVTEAKPYDAKNGYGPGVYKVGYDIPAGEYNVQQEDGSIMSYLEVSNSSRGDLMDIVSNDNFEGNKYITVKDGQYLKIQMGFIE